MAMYRLDRGKQFPSLPEPEASQSRKRERIPEPGQTIGFMPLPSLFSATRTPDNYCISRLAGRARAATPSSLAILNNGEKFRSNSCAFYSGRRMVSRFMRHSCTTAGRIGGAMNNAHGTWAAISSHGLSVSKGEAMAFIYFAYDLELNAVKVGSTFGSVNSRMTEELSLIGAVEIDEQEKHLRRLETAIHFCLRDHAIYGERFYPDKRVVTFIRICLSKGIDAALLRYGDNALYEIGLTEVFHMKKSRGSIRKGHPTRHYARKAWFRASYNGAYGGPRTTVRLVDLLPLCPLQEPFFGYSEIVTYKDNSDQCAVLKRLSDREEVVALYEQPPGGFFISESQAASN
jgi:hypothetical protein